MKLRILWFAGCCGICAVCTAEERDASARPTHEEPADARVRAEPNQATNVFDLKVVLTNTGVGPMGASAQAELATNQGTSPRTGSVSLSTQGLLPGHYELNVVTKSNRTVLPVGVIAISDPTASPDKQANDSKKEDNSAHQIEVLTSQSHMKLPEGLDLADVGEVMLSTLNGNAVLAGTAWFAEGQQ